MTDVVVQDKDVVVEVAQPTVPPTATPPHIGLVEINQTIARGSLWTTGHGAPTLPGGQFGDMYLDIDTGDIYSWTGAAWVFQGTFAPATLTPAEILAALLTVDGAGSGLDADLLDGQHGAYYAKQSDMTTETTRNDTQDTQIAQNSGDIAGNISAIATLNATKAPLASPAFTGDPTAPTPSPGDNDTSIATTAFVAAALTAGTLPADILAKLLTVDGAGSGLDADLLDGQHGAYYLDLLNATGILPAARFNDASHGARAGGNLHPLATAAIAGFMLDAPSDSFVYGRKNGAWSTVIGGATTDDSPPAGPLQDGQLWWKSSTGVLYLWYDDGNSQQWVQVSASPQIVDNNYARKTANRKNVVVNPVMQVSQENGSNTIAAGYLADQWNMINSGLSPQGSQSAGPSPARAKNVIVHSYSAAKASLAAGDYGQIYQAIEGQRIQDFAWGTAQAIPAVLRFSAKGDTPGTYTASITDPSTGYSFLAAFVLDAVGVWKTFTIPVPAPPGGTWPTDASASLFLHICTACGTTWGGGAAGWQVASKIAIAGQVNMAATANKNLWIGDVGLYADPDSTGIAPPFEVPGYNEDLFACCRYYEKQSSVLFVTSPNFNQRSWAANKRVAPTVSASGFNGGSGATVAATDNNGWFQSAAHSQAAQGNVIANARM